MTVIPVQEETIEQFLPQTEEMFPNPPAVNLPAKRSAMDRVIVVAAFEAEMKQGKVCLVRLLDACLAKEGF